MKRTFTSLMVAALVAAATPVLAWGSVEQEALVAARDLYAAAAYEDALASLDRLRNTQPPPGDGRTIEQYRAFCLIALGRTSDAERAIEAVVAADPLYRPTDGDLSPRVRTTFTSVRRRVLPAVVEQRYADAKAAYDRKDFASAAVGFRQVLDILKDPDLAAATPESRLADIQTLASGFRELSVKAAVPPPSLPTASAVVAPVTPPVAVSSPSRIYTLDDRDVVPPSPVSQTLPHFRGRVPMPLTGVVEIVIDESGAVTSATMRTRMSPEYDATLLQAARTWQYRPATANGIPVKFRRLVQVSLKPSA